MVTVDDWSAVPLTTRPRANPPTLPVSTTIDPFMVTEGETAAVL